MELDCVACNGKGGECEPCGGSGQMQVTSCPKTFAADAMEVVEFAELYAKGLPPVSGGALDQSRQFIEAARFALNEQAYWKAKQIRVTDD